MTVVKRKSAQQFSSAGPADTEQSEDVFNLVIEAAKRNGMSLESWLQEAVQQDHSRDDISQDEHALKRLLVTQRNSRAQAERAALLAQEELHQQTHLHEAGDKADADALALIEAIDDLSAQLISLKENRPDSDPQEASAMEALEPMAATTPAQIREAEAPLSDTRQAEAAETAAHTDAQAFDSLKARIAALKGRLTTAAQPEPETASKPSIVQPAIPAEASSPAPAAIKPAPPVAEPSVAEIVAASGRVKPAAVKNVVEKTPTRAAAPAQRQQRIRPDFSELDKKLERHFGNLGQKINSLLESNEAKPKSENDPVRAQLEASLRNLDARLKGLPTKEDVALLQPLAKLQVKLQADQEKLGDNFQRLADEQVRLQSGFAQTTNNAEYIADLHQQIANLETSLKAIKPAVTRDVASLLDVTVKKLAKAGKDQHNSPAQDAIRDQLDRLEQVVASLPAEVAQQQPNAQSIISFLPPRETLEAIEHTVGRLEAMLLEQQSTLSTIDTTQQTDFLKKRFDDLLTRLDDTMKRFDAASLDADRRAQASIAQQNSHNSSLMQQLGSQIENLEKRIEEAPALAVSNQDAAQSEMRSSHAELQDDLARIEAQLGSVMSTLEQHVSNASHNDTNSGPSRDARAVSSAVTDALVQPLNEALDRLERGLDARSRQTLDDLSALVKSSQDKPHKDDPLQRSLNSVPDTLTILLDKIYDLESGVNRLQAQRENQKAGSNERTKPHRQPKHHEVLPPEPNAKPNREAKRETAEQRAHGMDYISAARRATTERATKAAKPKGKAEEEASSIGKIKQRAESILSRQRDAVETDSDPSNRKKIVGICIGMTLIIAAIALALQSRDHSAISEPITTGSISDSTVGSLANKLVSNTFNKSDNASNPRIIEQKIPDRLPSPPGSRVWYSDKAEPKLANPSKVAMPVARPETTLTTPKASVFGAFVAPAPSKGIGPVALRFRAATGDPVAQFEIGSRYADGFGVKPDMVQAVNWYRLSAAQGLAPALYRLGSLLEHGRGTRQDKSTAASLYEKAAEKGNTKAMYNLGVLNAQGALGEPDFAKAAKWFTKAAEAGIKDGQFNLAILHARGMGVKTDLEKAYFWFAVAAKDKDPDAVAKRDALGQDLLTETLQAIDAKVAQWQPSRLPANANNVSMPKEGWLAVEVPADAESRLEKHSANTTGTAPDMANGIQAIFEQVDAIQGKQGNQSSESRI